MSIATKKETSARGLVRVINTENTKLRLKEIIYVGLSIKSNKSAFEIENWSKELKKLEPIESNFEHFSISRKEWFSNAKIFLIPTLTFGQTQIEIHLNEHVILGTGFTIELYLRNEKIGRIFKNNESITTSLGGLIKIKIQWQITNDENYPQITFHTEK